MIASVQKLAFAFAVIAELGGLASAQAQHWVDPAIGGAGGSGTPNDPFWSLQAAHDSSITASGDHLIIQAASFSENAIFDAKGFVLSSGAGQSVRWERNGSAPAASLIGVELQLIGIELRDLGSGPGPLLSLESAASLSLLESSIESSWGLPWADLEDSSLDFDDCSLVLNSSGRVSGGTLRVDNSVVAVASDVAPAMEFVSGSSLLASNTAIESDWNASVLDMDGGLCVLDACEIRLASTFDREGIKCVNSTVVMIGVSMTDPSPGYYGAENYFFFGDDCQYWIHATTVFALGETPCLLRGAGLIQDSSFSHLGGGIDLGVVMRLEGQIHVTGSEFSYLSAEEGRPIWVLGAVAFNDCAFTSNYGWEAPIQCQDDGAGRASFVGCEFRGNTADSWYGYWPNSWQAFAGAVSGVNYGGPGPWGAPTVIGRPSFDSCLFTENRAMGGGAHMAAVHCPESEILRCTFVGNVIDQDLSVDPTPPPAAVVTAGEVRGCLFAQNEAPISAIAGAVTYSLNSGQAGLGNLEGTPRFVDAASGDYRLLPCSLGIDAGDPACLDEFGTVCEMGAFSFDPADGAAAVQVCSGSPMAGCGAQLSVVGCASLGEGGIEVAVDQLAPGSWGVLLVGMPETTPAAYSSILCVGTPLLRYEPGLAQGSGACGGTRSFVLDDGLLGLLGVAAGDSLVLSYLSRAPGNPGALESSNGVLLGPLR